MYVWIAREKGFDVSDTSFFVYVDAQHKGIQGMLVDEEPTKAWMEFAISIISYEADPSWVESKLLEIRGFLLARANCPEHTPISDNYVGCDLGRYIEKVLAVLGR